MRVGGERIPPLDPDCAAALGRLPVRPPLHPSNLAELRTDPILARPSDEALARGGRFAVRECVADRPEGNGQVPLVVCRPAREEGPTPLLLYIHGGGMVLGTARDGLDEVVELAAARGAAVVSVEYRLAPETPHPGPVEDCYAALRWAAGHAEDLGVDPGRVVVVGSSAGGGLAASLALLCRDRGGPPLAGVLLMAPMLDDRNDSPSIRQLAGLATWNRAANEVGWSALLGNVRGPDAVSPYGSPARSSDLSGLPPVFIDVGSVDSFRSECLAFAERIWLDGGAAELHVWAGAYHGSDALAPQAAVTRAAVAVRCAWLQRLLAP